jgi:glycerol-1-phosphate dehydrogenase [NAD(P)+]
MLIPKQTVIPSLVRVKPGALDRVGIYAERDRLMRVVLFFSQDLIPQLMERLTVSLEARDVRVLQQVSIESISSEKTIELFQD